MLKTLIKVMVVSILGCSIAFAANNPIEGKEKITRNGVDIYLEPNSPDKQRILNGEFDKSLQSMKKAYEASKNTKATRAAAPTVSEVDILEVGSQQGGKEQISKGQMTTNMNHGGSPFYVVTGVLGYGGTSTDSATFVGSPIKHLGTAMIDTNNDQIADDWWIWWDLSTSPNSNGPFAYTARSNNFGPTMSASIQIR